MRYILVFSTIFTIFTAATINANAIDYRLTTPYHTVETLITNLGNGVYNPTIAANALYNESLSEEALGEQAIKLKQIFDGAGIVIDLGSIPKDADFRDTTLSGSPERYIISDIYPDLYVEKQDDLWMFSKHSVAKIDVIHSEVFPFGTDKLLNLLPIVGEDNYFGLFTWQIISIIALILIGFLVYRAFTLFFEYVIVQSLIKLGYKGAIKQFIIPVAKPLSIFAILYVYSLFIKVLQLPAEIAHYALLVLDFLKPLFLTIVFYKIVDVACSYFKKLAEKTASTLDDQLVPLLRKTLKTFVILVGTLFILKEGLKIDIWPLITGLSIGGLAFALAAQDTIKNFFGSLMIFVDKPFQVGDWITSGDIDGSVEEVGFRSTRIRSFRNSLYYVPNGKLADATIDNHGLRQYRRYSTTLMLPFDTPPELIELFIEGLRKIVERHPDTRKDAYHIYLNEITAYSANIMFYIFFKVPTWSQELQGRHSILLQVLELANSIDIRLAVPTSSIQVEKFPEKKSALPNYAGGIGKSLDNFNNFFEQPRQRSN